MGDTVHILLVEPSDCQRDTIVQALQAALGQVEISHTTNLAETEQMLRQNVFDCALVAYRLADGGVDELLAAAKPEYETPMIILWDAADEEAAHAAVSRGAQDCLPKDNFANAPILYAIRYAKERKRAETLQVQLARSDRLSSIGQLVTSIAHEINNPTAFISANLEVMKPNLARIAGLLSGLRDFLAHEVDAKRRTALSSLLKSSKAEEVVREYAEICDESLIGVRRIASIVKDLKVFVRSDEDPPQIVQINDIITFSCRMVQNEVRHRGRLVKNLGRVPQIVAKKSHLGQIVVNLLLNAAQALDESQREDNLVEISSRFAAGKIYIAVRDTGPGIKPEWRERIFEPFFTTKPEGTGSGLGLALCSEMARQHGGDIRFVSPPEGGAKFEVVLPEETGLTSPLPAVDNVAKPVRPMRILIIDDEEEILSALRRMLEPIHQVSTAASGAAALANLEGSSQYDVVICDLMMPAPDGAAVFESVRQSYPHLVDRVVLCSGGAVSRRSREFLNDFPNPVLHKPVSSELLSRVIAQVGGDAE